MACAFEEGFDPRFIRRCVGRLFEEENAGSSRGQGGARVKGFEGMTADEHSFHITTQRMHASAWFEWEKQLTDSAPNEEGHRVYQIERLEIDDFYREFVLDMSDVVKLKQSDIPSQLVWKDVWLNEHSDLVMREELNVSAKDKVSEI